MSYQEAAACASMKSNHRDTMASDPRQSIETFLEASSDWVGYRNLQDVKAINHAGGPTETFGDSRSSLSAYSFGKHEDLRNHFNAPSMFG